MVEILLFCYNINSKKEGVYDVKKIIQHIYGRKRFREGGSSGIRI